MKLLQIMAGAPHGGAEAFFERLVRAFAARGVDQHVVIRENARRKALLAKGGVDAVEIPFGGWFDRRTVHALADLTESLAPDIALTWMNRATRAYARAMSGRTVRPVHIARLGGYYDLKYYRGCDYLIGNTKEIVTYLVGEGWPAGRATYMPNFVDATPAEAVARASLETPEDATLLVALGRLHENKAFDVLIEALAGLENHWLWLAGVGPLEARLREQAAAAGVLDRVRFLGWRDNVAALLAAADILVCPSRHEPLGNVVIEAWAHRVPVVACASQGPSQLIDDGVNGLLVPIDHADGLAAAISRIGEAGIAAGLVEAGEAAYRRDYSEAVVVDAYLDFFDIVRVTEVA
jgi:glycosyltransferase involved in cell wall biosynthesis